MQEILNVKSSTLKQAEEVLEKSLAGNTTVDITPLISWRNKLRDLRLRIVNARRSLTEKAKDLSDTLHQLSRYEDGYKELVTWVEAREVEYTDINHALASASLRTQMRQLDKCQASTFT